MQAKHKTGERSNRATAAKSKSELRLISMDPALSVLLISICVPQAYANKSIILSLLVKWPWISTNHAPRLLCSHFDFGTLHTVAPRLWSSHYNCKRACLWDWCERLCGLRMVQYCRQRIQRRRQTRCTFAKSNSSLVSMKMAISALSRLCASRQSRAFRQRRQSGNSKFQSTIEQAAVGIVNCESKHQQFTHDYG